MHVILCYAYIYNNIYIYIHIDILYIYNVQTRPGAVILKLPGLLDQWCSACHKDCRSGLAYSLLELQEYACDNGPNIARCCSKHGYQALNVCPKRLRASDSMLLQVQDAARRLARSSGQGKASLEWIVQVKLLFVSPGILNVASP